MNRRRLVLGASLSVLPGLVLFAWRSPEREAPSKGFIDLPTHVVSNRALGDRLTARDYATQGYESGVVALGRNADGRLEAIALDTEGRAVHNTQREPNGLWTSWRPIGAARGLRQVAIDRNADGRLELVGRDAPDGRVWHAWQLTPNGDWSGWEVMGDAVGVDQIALGANADGRLEVFALMESDGSAWHIGQLAPNGGWGPWAVLEGVRSFRHIALGVNEDGRLEVFAVSGSDGSAFHVWQKTPNGSWGGWATLSHAPMLLHLAADQNADGRMVLVASDADDGRVWTNWQDAKNGRFSGWLALGDARGIGQVAVNHNADGRLEVFALDAKEGTAFHTWQRMGNGGWSAWEQLLEQRGLLQLAVNHNADGSLEVVAADVNARLATHAWQFAPNGEWRGWEFLGDVRLLLMQLERCKVVAAFRPMDLVVDQWDDNCLPLNPRWKFEVTTHFPPNVQLLCGISSNTWNKSACTSQRVISNTTPNIWLNNGCNDPNNANLGYPGLYAGHLNWGPVTVTGPVVLVRGYDDSWAAQNTVGFDADMDFAIRPPQGRGLTTANWGEGHDGQIEPEWDGYEVFAGFNTTPWWDTLSRYRNTDADPDSRAFKIVNPDYPNPPKGRNNSVVIGQFGIDCRHFCHTELHPTYAMAIHTQESRTDDRWAVFARNWGDEGSCGNDQVPVGMGSFSMRLGHPFAVSVVINEAEFVARNGIYDEGTTVLTPPLVGWNLDTHVVNPGTPEAAVILTMTVPRGTWRPVMLGELALTWTERLVMSPAARAALAASQKSFTVSAVARAAAVAAAGKSISHNPAAEKAALAHSPPDDAHLEAIMSRMTPAQFDVFRTYARRAKLPTHQQALAIQRNPHITPVRIGNWRDLVQSIPDTVNERRARQLGHAICMAYDGKPPVTVECDSLK